MENEIQPIGVLFDSINYYKIEDLNKFIDELTPEQSIYVITQAASYGFKRGIFNLQESEVLSKSLRVFNQIQKLEE